jgi:hypothetical protein
MNKPITLWFTVLVTALFPPAVQAQNVSIREGYDYDGKAVTALFPFIGEQDAAKDFNNAVERALGDLKKYSCRIVTAETIDAAGVRIPTDMPPIKELVSGVRFAITGGVYPGNYEGEYYLQLWLWDMSNATMIYTDDLVYQDIETGLESLPGLVEWLFSHIIEKPVAAEEETETVWGDKRIYLGLRSGVSSHWYTAPEEIAPGAHSLNYEGGIFITARLTALISLQAEADFIWDDLVYRGISDTSDGAEYTPVLVNKRYRSFSLFVPFFFKLNLRPGNFRLAPYGGLFAFVPLGKTLYRVNPGGEDDTFSRSVTVPIGLTAGFEVGRKLGPGILLADIRYSVDLGKTTLNDAVETSYNRGMVSFTLGYALGFMDVKK